MPQKKLRGFERLLAGADVPEDFDTLTSALRNYLNTLDDMQKSGEAAVLLPATLRRMFEIGFTLDQFRRDAAVMIEIAQGVPKPRPSLVAAVKAWLYPRA